MASGHSLPQVNLSVQGGTQGSSHRAFSAQELDAPILGLNLNTSPGPDGIHDQMISLLGLHGKQRLLELLNDSWSLGRLPRDWKKAIVVPIRKPGKDIASSGSFRPSALTSITWLGLKPCLVYTFLAGIEKVIPNDCEIGIFGDDIVLWSSGSDTEKVEESVNLALVDVWNFANPVEQSAPGNRETPKVFGLHIEILSNRHLEHLALRAMKRIKILKYISGRDWVDDAGTLRNTYVSLIHPILEYGFPIFCCSCDSNLKKFERVQLSAARIITGLRDSCPKDIVLYEADLQPLSLRRNACLVKYYSKLSGLGFQNCTSKYLMSWSSHQRLQRGSSFEHIHFQWIPSHVNITGNEIAYSLARAVASETTTLDASLTYLELFSKYKAKNKAIWLIPPLHPWYQSKYPGGSLVQGSSKGDQTALTRFLSGHLM
ncbi:putative RNA-directed DNA polymerase from transposon BS [Trichonephila clavipes]|nr:putative RNA-directed DNA polymerase from transposon BS [Trichonephila clavipes]